MKRQTKYKTKIIVLVLLISAPVALLVLKYNSSHILPADSVERLLSLPYLSSCEVDQSERDLVGVTKYVPELCYDGYNLYGRRILAMNGDLLKILRSGLFVFLPDNTIVGQHLLKLARLPLKGEAIWTNQDLIHHEIFLTAQNTILTITKSLPINVDGEAILYNGRKVGFDTILEYDLDGELIDSWSSRENLNDIKKYYIKHNNPGLDFPLQSNKVPKMAADIVRSQFNVDYDYFHLNSVQSLPETKLKDHLEFKPGNWLVSSPKISMIFIIDKDTKKIVWSYGPGVIISQHSPRMLDTGNILIFDNGNLKRSSRVIEIDPVSKKIVWEYGSATDQQFFSKVMGHAQRLPNGNTLISDSSNGRAFEVTYDGRIVWEFYNKILDNKGRLTFYRMKRYSKKELDSIVNPFSGALIFLSFSLEVIYFELNLIEKLVNFYGLSMWDSIDVHRDFYKSNIRNLIVSGSNRWFY